VLFGKLSYRRQKHLGTLVILSFHRLKVEKDLHRIRVHSQGNLTPWLNREHTAKLFAIRCATRANASRLLAAEPGLIR
jgi:hypothetical protein